MIFLNHKMNLTKEELLMLIEKIKELPVVLFPTEPLLGLASEKFENLGSQDVSEYKSGSYTGQTSVETLKSLGIKYCLIGHSEKRLYLNENLVAIINKINLCLEHDITPIYIIGESKNKNIRSSEKIIKKELKTVFRNLKGDISKVIICYEPTWSIGKESPKPKYIYEMTKEIKNFIQDNFNINTKVLYGGGVNKKNIKELSQIDNVDGFLIGEASLSSDEIKQIYEITKR